MTNKRPDTEEQPRQETNPSLLPVRIRGRETQPKGGVTPHSTLGERERREGDP